MCRFALAALQEIPDQCVPLCSCCYCNARLACSISVLLLILVSATCATVVASWSCLFLAGPVHLPIFTWSCLLLPDPVYLVLFILPGPVLLACAFGVCWSQCESRCISTASCSSHYICAQPAVAMQSWIQTWTFNDKLCWGYTAARLGWRSALRIGLQAKGCIQSCVHAYLLVRLVCTPTSHRKSPCFAAANTQSGKHSKRQVRTLANTQGAGCCCRYQLIKKLRLMGPQSTPAPRPQQIQVFDPPTGDHERASTASLGSDRPSAPTYPFVPGGAIPGLSTGPLPSPTRI